jgi:hypothetical protein
MFGLDGCRLPGPGDCGSSRLVMGSGFGGRAGGNLFR